MKIGLYDMDSHNYPNLVLMKLSAYYKNKGDNVEWYIPLNHYDIVFVSKVFSEEYSKLDTTFINADKIYFGGTGFCIKVINEQEVYNEEFAKEYESLLGGEFMSHLPNEIEHIMPDYSIYDDLTKDTAFGFLTRGCPNNCSFCIVSKKCGRCSVKVADLSEFWNGQKNIDILDPNILACKDHIELLNQIIKTNAKVNFNQGLDARFINEENVQLLKQIKIKNIHFAFDFMKNEEKIVKGLKLAKANLKFNDKAAYVYMLTNYDTTRDEDMRRIRLIKECGYMPYVMIYRKKTAPQFLKDLQRWCNNRFLYGASDFMDYIPRKNNLTIKQIYFKKENNNERK